MHAFSSVGDRDRLVLNVPKERLDMARGFDKSTWPNINDRQYQAEMERYLNGVPATRGSSSSGASGTGTTAGSAGTRGTTTR
jgi:hypothetical protein